MSGFNLFGIFMFVILIGLGVYVRYVFKFLVMFFVVG